MVVPVTEFVIFKLKSSVKPEDHSNEEGASLCKIFSATKQQSGHQSSAWGRTVEDKNVVVWAVGESLAKTKIPACIYQEIVEIV